VPKGNIGPDLAAQMRNGALDALGATRWIAAGWPCPRTESPPSTAMGRDSARVHLAGPGSSQKPSGDSCARKLVEACTSKGYLEGQKRDVDRLKVPACIKPDVCYKQGYLSGFTESSSRWSFFTQWNEVLFRCDGSALQHGQSAALAGPKLGPCASSGRACGARMAQNT
jgi:hypothetical protein